MHKPKLLLLDEPTAGVDPKARREFWDEIHRLARDGLTVLVSTHYMDEAERCHRISYISYGRMLASGTVEEVVTNAGLTTFVVEGERLNEVAAALAGQAGRRTDRAIRRHAACRRLRRETAREVAGGTLPDATA